MRIDHGSVQLTWSISYIKSVRSTSSFSKGGSSKVYVACFPLYWGYIWLWVGARTCRCQRCSQSVKYIWGGGGQGLFEIFSSVSKFFPYQFAEMTMSLISSIYCLIMFRLPVMTFYHIKPNKQCGLPCTISAIDDFHAAFGTIFLIWVSFCKAGKMAVSCHLFC